MDDLIIFNNKFYPAFGGMESHFYNALKYFIKDSEWNCKYIISKEKSKHIILNNKLEKLYYFDDIYTLSKVLYNKIEKSNSVFMFNNGMWIEDLKVLRENFKNVLFTQRTGGNEFVKAPLSTELPLSESQMIWANNINQYLDIMISNSEFTNERLRNIGVLEKKIIKIRGGISEEQCKKNLLNKKSNREKFDLRHYTSNKIIITTASRLIPFKNIELLIESIGKSKYKNKIFFLCIGDGSEKNKLYNLSKKILKNNFCFFGSTDYTTTLKLISISDIYCSSSKNFYKKRENETYLHTETMGRSILEAKCQNVYLIATNVGGVSEWFFENQEIGSLIESENLSELVNTIDTVIDNSHYLKINNCFCYSYDWNNLFAEYKRIWRKSIDERDIANNIKKK